MPRRIDYTIAYKPADGDPVDLCKILFGGDGSYYVTAPYHPFDRAVAAIITVNYTATEGYVSLSDALELGVVEDDQQRLKLAHHPDGFLQFSGTGIRSGRDSSGKPKGIGVTSWPLLQPTLGPSFNVAFSAPTKSGRATQRKPRTILLRESDVSHMRTEKVPGLRITGYYLPVPWREFVHQREGEQWIDLVHPNAQAVKKLRVALASKESDLPGLIGLEAVPHGINVADKESGFFLSSSTGNLRRNEKGELLGDQLVCMYPALDVGDARLSSLTHPLPAPSYKAPPGTTDV